MLRELQETPGGAGVSAKGCFPDSGTLETAFSEVCSRNLAFTTRVLFHIKYRQQIYSNVSFSADSYPR